MLISRLRLGFLLATLVVSLHVAAAPRYWTLTLGFKGGSQASGYFNYDDATQTLSNWNVQVDSAFGAPGFVYVPANSTTSVIQPPGGGAPTLVFSALMGVPGRASAMREFRIVPLGALDGSNATVSLGTDALPPHFGAVPGTSREDFRHLGSPDSEEALLFRVVSTGSLALMPVPPSTNIVRVYEFYHPGLRHYFITADLVEKENLDTGQIDGWQRTPESFKAYGPGSNTSDSINPVCRYYSPPPTCYPDEGCYFGADSHFFSADAGECLNVGNGYSVFWGQEFANAFQIALPDKTNGACPGGTVPVYRLWNQREDSNHRYTTSTAIRAQMLAAGFVSEGYGPDGVVMCALQ